MSPAPSPKPKPLRTVVCTRGGLFGALVLERLRVCEQIEVCAIVRSSRVFDPACGFLRGASALVRRSGTAYALYLFLATTVADVARGFSSGGRVPLRTATQGLPVLRTRNINQPDGLRFLKDQAPDLLVSAFFDQRLHEAALRIPALACLNIHPSLLPSFKGVDPVLQARLSETTPIGVTVHHMTPLLDSGRILAQRAVVVPHEASIFEATARLYDAGAQLLAATVGRIEHAKNGNDAPDNALGSYQSWPSRAEIRSLRAAGSALIRVRDLRLTWQ